MKTKLPRVSAPLLFLLSLGSLLLAGEKDAKPAVAAVAAPAYIDEAPLPEGWPQPGPYNAVAEKKYPAYRGAFTTQTLEFTGFWTLFSHLKKNNLPMTAPVEIGVEPSENGKALKQRSMGFMYQKDDTGKTGPDGQAVIVKDIPPARALSYAWQGKDSQENKAKARAALDSALAEKKLTAKSLRLLGYNGPETPADKRTWELQALIE